MPKPAAPKRRAADRILEGLEAVQAYVEGRHDPAEYRVHVPEAIDVKAIRTRLKLSQARFADRFGFSAATVREWEQGRRTPEKAARVLLTVIAREPEAVDRALRGSGKAA